MKSLVQALCAITTMLAGFDVMEKSANIQGANPQDRVVKWKDCPGTDLFTKSTPKSLETCVALSGAKAVDRLRVRLGDTPARLQATSSVPLDFDPVFFTDHPINLVWEVGSTNFVFNDLGGTGHSILLLDLGIKDERLNGVSFDWQNRPLRLEEALDKAQGFQDWLKAEGFRTSKDKFDPRPFEITGEDDFRRGVRSKDWSAAQAWLADETADATRMHLYTMDSKGAKVSVSIENARRQAWQFGKKAGTFHALGPDQRQSIFDGNGGYEWFLKINLDRQE